ncbi:hypothetical protein JCM19236_3131 [Vibrio sp. JCM 19236]|nr:hypothetical protein JCM19236_3131 [Vibrio sp. JCM 19236]
MASIGVPKDSIIKYESDIKADKYLIVLDLDKSEIELAKSILAEHKTEMH